MEINIECSAIINDEFSQFMDGNSQIYAEQESIIVGAPQDDGGQILSAQFKQQYQQPDYAHIIQPQQDTQAITIKDQNKKAAPFEVQTFEIVELSPVKSHRDSEVQKENQENSLQKSQLIMLSSTENQKQQCEKVQNSVVQNQQAASSTVISASSAPNQIWEKVSITKRRVVNNNSLMCATNQSQLNPSKLSAHPATPITLIKHGPLQNYNEEKHSNSTSNFKRDEQIKKRMAAKKAEANEPLPVFDCLFCAQEHFVLFKINEQILINKFSKNNSNDIFTTFLILNSLNKQEKHSLNPQENNLYQQLDNQYNDTKQSPSVFVPNIKESSNKFRKYIIEKETVKQNQAKPVLLRLIKHKQKVSNLLAQDIQQIKADNLVQENQHNLTNKGVELIKQEQNAISKTNAAPQKSGAAMMMLSNILNQSLLNETNLCIQQRNRRQRVLENISFESEVHNIYDPYFSSEEDLSSSSQDSSEEDEEEDDSVADEPSGGGGDAQSMSNNSMTASYQNLDDDEDEEEDRDIAGGQEDANLSPVTNNSLSSIEIDEDEDNVVDFRSNSGDVEDEDDDILSNQVKIQGGPIQSNQMEKHQQQPLDESDSLECGDGEDDDSSERLTFGCVTPTEEDQKVTFSHCGDNSLSPVRIIVGEQSQKITAEAYKNLTLKQKQQAFQNSQVQALLSPLSQGAPYQNNQARNHHHHHHNNMVQIHIDDHQQHNQLNNIDFYPTSQIMDMTQQKSYDTDMRLGNMLSQISKPTEESKDSMMITNGHRHHHHHHHKALAGSNSSDSGDDGDEEQILSQDFIYLQDGLNITNELGVKSKGNSVFQKQADSNRLHNINSGGIAQSFNSNLGCSYKHQKLMDGPGNNNNNSNSNTVAGVIQSTIKAVEKAKLNNQSNLLTKLEKPHKSIDMKQILSKSKIEQIIMRQMQNLSGPTNLRQQKTKDSRQFQSDKQIYQQNTSNGLVGTSLEKSNFYKKNQNQQQQLIANAATHHTRQMALHANVASRQKQSMLAQEYTQNNNNNNDFGDEGEDEEYYDEYDQEIEEEFQSISPPEGQEDTKFSQYYNKNQEQMPDLGVSSDIPNCGSDFSQYEGDIHHPMASVRGSQNLQHQYQIQQQQQQLQQQYFQQQQQMEKHFTPMSLVRSDQSRGSLKNINASLTNSVKKRKAAKQAAALAAKKQKIKLNIQENNSTSYGNSTAGNLMGGGDKKAQLSTTTTNLKQQQQQLQQQQRLQHSTKVIRLTKQDISDFRTTTAATGTTLSSNRYATNKDPIFATTKMQSAVTKQRRINHQTPATENRPKTNQSTIKQNSKLQHKRDYSKTSHQNNQASMVAHDLKLQKQQTQRQQSKKLGVANIGTTQSAKQQPAARKRSQSKNQQEIQQRQQMNEFGAVMMPPHSTISNYLNTINKNNSDANLNQWSLADQNHPSTHHTVSVSHSNFSTAIPIQRKRPHKLNGSIEGIQLQTFLNNMDTRHMVGGANGKTIHNNNHFHNQTVTSIGRHTNGGDAGGIGRRDDTLHASTLDNLVITSADNGYNRMAGINADGGGTTSSNGQFSFSQSSVKLNLTSSVGKCKNANKKKKAKNSNGTNEAKAHRAGDMGNVNASLGGGIGATGMSAIHNNTTTSSTHIKNSSQFMSIQQQQKKKAQRKRSSSKFSQSSARQSQQQLPQQLTQQPKQTLPSHQLLMSTQPKQQSIGAGKNPQQQLMILKNQQILLGHQAKGPSHKQGSIGFTTDVGGSQKVEKTKLKKLLMLQDSNTAHHSTISGLPTGSGYQNNHLPNQLHHYQHHHHHTINSSIDQSSNPIGNSRLKSRINSNVDIPNNASSQNLKNVSSSMGNMAKAGNNNDKFQSTGQFMMSHVTSPLRALDYMGLNKQSTKLAKK